jgi:hypothetical protein
MLANTEELVAVDEALDDKKWGLKSIRLYSKMVRGVWYLLPKEKI